MFRYFCQLTCLLFISVVVFSTTSASSTLFGILFYGYAAALLLLNASAPELCRAGLTILIALGLLHAYMYIYLAASSVVLCMRYTFYVAGAPICLFVKITAEASLICLAYTFLILLGGLFTLDYLLASRKIYYFVFYVACSLCGIMLLACAHDLLTIALAWWILSFFTRRLLLFYIGGVSTRQIFIWNFIKLARALDWFLYGAFLYIFLISKTTLLFWTIHASGYSCYLQHRVGMLCVYGIIIGGAYFKSLHLFLINWISPFTKFSIVAALFIYTGCAAFSGIILIIHLNCLWCYHLALQQVLYVMYAACAVAALLAARRRPTLKQFFSCVAFYQSSYLLASACTYGCTFAFFQPIFFIFIKLALFILSSWLLHVRDATTFSYQVRTPRFYSIIYLSLNCFILCGALGTLESASLWFCELFLVQAPLAVIEFGVVYCALAAGVISLMRRSFKLKRALLYCCNKKKQIDALPASAPRCFYVACGARNYKCTITALFWLRSIAECHIFFLVTVCYLYFFII